MAAKKKRQGESQTEKRQGIDVGPLMGQVSTAAYWYRQGHFANDDEAQGAFKLAYQQAMDGMGTSIQAWMGLTEREYAHWSRAGKLPPKKK